MDYTGSVIMGGGAKGHFLVMSTSKRLKRGGKRGVFFVVFFKCGKITHKLFFASSVFCLWPNFCWH